MKADKRIFVNPNGGAWKGGMDKDSSLRYVQNGYYRDARNVSFMVNGDRFVLKNIKGNTQKSYTLNRGSNVCIGAYDDKGNETLYAFIWNGAGDHEILKYEYNISVDTVSLLAEGEGLAFEVDKLITGITVVNDRFLVWGQESQEIGCIDLDNPPASAIATADRWEVELNKIPDLEAPEVMYVTDEQRSQNALKEELYQFRYRNIYEGGFRSPMSVISKVPIPDVQFLEYWDAAYLPYYDNTIQLEIPQPAFDKVEKVELFVRAANNDSEKDAGLWYKFGEIDATLFDATTQPTMSYTYTGNEQLEPVDPAEALSEVTFFPKSCKEVVFLPSNVLAFLNFKDGLDVSTVEPEVEAFATYNARPTSAGSTTTTATYSNAGTVFSRTKYNPKYNIEQTAVAYDTITIAGTPRVGDVVGFDIYLDYSGTTPSSVTLPASGTRFVTAVYIIKREDVQGNLLANRATVARKLARAINAVDTRYRGFGGIVAEANSAVVRLYEGANANNSPYTITTTVNSSTTGAFTAGATVTANYPTNLGTVQWEVRRAEKTFKRGARHPFAIEYLDGKGRRSGAIPIGDVFVQDTWETSNDGWTYMNFVIGHLAPSWATNYQILYAKNQTFEQFLQLPADATSLGGNTYSIGVPTSIDNFNLIYQDGDGVTPNYEYFYVEGDRAKVLGAVNAGNVTLFTTNCDAKILRADTSDIIINSSNTELSTAVGLGYDLIVQVYRPKKASARVYYEIAYQGTVDSDGYHSGNVSDQDASNGAEVILDNHGDAYNIYIQRINPAVNADESFFEHQGVSALFQSNVTDTGRANVELEYEGEFNRDAAITFTQPIVNNIGTSNGLSVVLSTSLYNEFGSDFGSIQKAFLRQDRVLVIFFEDKVGQMGVFSELRKSADGNLSYATDSLTNQINFYSYDGGIGINPESFAYYDTTCYFLSPRNNAVCRLGNDGITEVSKYGMTTWFHDNLDVKSNALTGLRATGVYDERNSSYVISFRQILGLTYISSFGADSIIVQPNTDLPYGADLITTSDTIIVTDDNRFLANQYIITPTSVSFDSGTGYFTITYEGALDPTEVGTAYLVSEIETLMFNEQANAWASFLDFQPDFMATCGVDFVSYKDGGTWLHNSNNTRGSFYGTGYDAEVTVPFNLEPSEMKVFLNIEQETNDPWYSDTDGDVTTPAGQTSVIYDEWYSQTQPNQYDAWIGKDTSTPTALVPANKEFEGFDLRDTVLSIRMVQDSTSDSKLESVTVKSETSNLSY